MADSAPPVINNEKKDTPNLNDIDSYRHCLPSSNEEIKIGDNCGYRAGDFSN
jgi:hypothetical protein